MEEKGGFDYGINLQFIISCRAQVMEFRQLNAEDLIALILEAIALTYEKFEENSVEGDMLIFEESNLLLKVLDKQHVNS